VSKKEDEENKLLINKNEFIKKLQNLDQIQLRMK